VYGAGTRRLERPVAYIVSPVDGVSGVFASEIDILENMTSGF